MACVVRVYGAGIDCSNGSNYGNFGFRDFPEGTTLEPSTGCGYSGLRPRVNGVLLGEDATYHPSGVTVTRVGCGPKPDEPYDCVNGGCVPKTTYGTPGKYATLAACQSGCAKDSNCTGECIDSAEIAALQQAANKLKTTYCG